jgi:hypothetical protein
MSYNPRDFALGTRNQDARVASTSLLRPSALEKLDLLDYSCRPQAYRILAAPLPNRRLAAPTGNQKQVSACYSKTCSCATTLYGDPVLIPGTRSEHR